MDEVVKHKNTTYSEFKNKVEGHEDGLFLPHPKKEYIEIWGDELLHFTFRTHEDFERVMDEYERDPELVHKVRKGQRRHDYIMDNKTIYREYDMGQDKRYDLIGSKIIGFEPRYADEELTEKEKEELERMVDKEADGNCHKEYHEYVWRFLEGKHWNGFKGIEHESGNVFRFMQRLDMEFLDEPRELALRVELMMNNERRA